MAPERYEGGGPILQDSEVIRDQLLPAQQQLLGEFESGLDTDLEGVRNKLGYAQVSDGNADGLVDTRISDKTIMVTPTAVEHVLPVTQNSAIATRAARRGIASILHNRDDRMLVVAGPCSIHDPDEALEYAEWLLEARDQHKGELEIIMRAYPEKPRTELGWKGFMYDPLKDGSHDLNLGVIVWWRTMQLARAIQLIRKHANTVPAHLRL
jgi:3-deoxy-7-phosphoheptulonate synthase